MPHNVCVNVNIHGKFEFFRHRFVHGLCLNANLHPVKLVDINTLSKSICAAGFRWNIENPVSRLMRRRYFSCGSVHLEDRNKLPRRLFTVTGSCTMAPATQTHRASKGCPQPHKRSSHINMPDQPEQPPKGDQRIRKLMTQRRSQNRRTLVVRTSGESRTQGCWARGFLMGDLNVHPGLVPCV